MATANDFLSGDDLDAILSLIDDDIFEQENEFVTLVNSNVSEVLEDGPTIYTCDNCEKVCKSNKGLKRHITMMHGKGNYSVAQHQETPEEPKAEAILHPITLKKLTLNSLEKFEKEQLYPDDILTELQTYKVRLNIEDILITYSYIKLVILEFKGNAEHFYHHFYDCVTKANNFFNGLSRNPSLLLGFELANHVLAYLNKSNYEGGIIKQKAERVILTEKEHACIGYLGGYVLGTFYRRIRHSKSWENNKSQQCLALLLAGKCSQESAETTKSVHKLVNARNRGGLWTVSAEVIKIFRIAEIQFCESSSGIVFKINCQEIVNKILKDSEVISNFTCICNKAEYPVENDVATDLLESLLTLYVRVRAHSYAKQLKEKHMKAAKKQRTKALRTELKKASSNQGQAKR